jgi:hypothetical protein
MAATWVVLLVAAPFLSKAFLEGSADREQSAGSISIVQFPFKRNCIVAGVLPDNVEKSITRPSP